MFCHQLFVNLFFLRTFGNLLNSRKKQSLLQKELVDAVVVAVIQRRTDEQYNKPNLPLPTVIYDYINQGTKD